MRYDEFRDQFCESLAKAGLFFAGLDRPTETIDLSTTERRLRAFVLRNTSQRAEPFTVSVEIAFRWSPVESARSRTCEEDLLTELHGRNEQPTNTEPRELRVDITLYAKLPYGSTTPMPEPQVFGPWIAVIEERLDEPLPAVSRKGRGRRATTMGYRGEVEVAARHSSEGVLSLVGLSLSGFRIVHVPRVWDDPERRETEKGAARELDQLALWFKGALDGWAKSVAELATWIRYSPPPSAASSDEGPTYGDDEKDAGPEMTH